MQACAVYLNGFSFHAVLVRLFLAMCFGGMIGIEREQKKKFAGFRTYMLVCIGAALTLLLGQYLTCLIQSGLLGPVSDSSSKTDVTRFGAQVINGIGFLGAGTIIVTKNQEVKGATTAAALWASACMGLVIGAGYYSCAAISFLLIFLCIRILPPMESFLLRRSRNLNLYIEFEALEDVKSIILFLRKNQIAIIDIDLDRGKTEMDQFPSAVLALRQRHRGMHNQMIRELFTSAPIRRIVEL